MTEVTPNVTKSVAKSVDVSRLPLGEILIRSRKLTKEQLYDALKISKENGKRLGETLTGMGIQESDIVGALALQKKVGYKTFEKLYPMLNPSSVSGIAGLTKEYCVSSKVCPLAISGDRIAIVSNDYDLNSVKYICRLAGIDMAKAHIFMACSEDIYDTINEVFKNVDVEGETEPVVDLERIRNMLEYDDEGDERVRTAKQVKLLTKYLDVGVNEGVSDIHIDAKETDYLVRMRINGRLQTITHITRELGELIVGRVSVLIDKTILNAPKPIDGRFIHTVSGTNKKVSLRVATIPTVHGTKVVMRILPDISTVPTMEKIWQGDYLSTMLRFCKMPHGLILFCGPTGSGKSTSVASILKHLNTDDMNIMTVEDPVEYIFDGINQVQINIESGELNFSTSLRSILRLDPNVVFIGEMRDSETANITLQACSIGRLAISTIHTNDALSGVARLEELGVERYKIVDNLIAVIAQRLVPLICPHCSYERNLTENELGLLRRVSNTKKKTTLEARGCVKCKNTRTVGRVPLFEIFEIGNQERNMIRANKSKDEIELYEVSKGFRKLVDYAVDLFEKDKINFEAVLAVADTSEKL